MKTFNSQATLKCIRILFFLLPLIHRVRKVPVVQQIGVAPPLHRHRGPVCTEPHHLPRLAGELVLLDRKQCLVGDSVAVVGCYSGGGSSHRLGGVFGGLGSRECRPYGCDQIYVILGRPVPGNVCATLPRLRSPLHPRVQPDRAVAVLAA